MRKKYHLIAWNVVCLSKAQGGLSVLDLNWMNLFLLSKYWFRFKDPTIQGKWKSIIISKYNFSCLASGRFSHFWFGIIQVSDMVNLDINCPLGVAPIFCFGLTVGLVTVLCIAPIQIYLE